MKRTLGIVALIALMALTTSCLLFEDVGSDPHPPTVTITGLVHFVDPVAPPPSAALVEGKTISFDSGGFTVSPGENVQIARTYSDAGGDIVKFTVRDRDGELATDLTPANTYYPGTFGTVVGPEAGLEIKGLSGVHRLELWAEDSHESRSEKVEFTVTLVY
jgi:hypothetical protein